MARPESGFVCPSCGHGRTRVIVTTAMLRAKTSSIARERRCQGCQQTFYTIERLHNRPARKLASHQAAIIRRLHKRGVTQAELARRYEVSRRLIWSIVHNQTWLPYRNKATPGAKHA